MKISYSYSSKKACTLNNICTSYKGFFYEVDKPHLFKKKSEEYKVEQNNKKKRDKKRTITTGAH